MLALADLSKAQRILIKSIDAITSQHLQTSGYVEHDRKGNASGNVQLWDTQDRHIAGGSEAITPMYAMGIGWCSADAAAGGMCRTNLRDLAMSDLVLLYQAALRWHEKDKVKP
jgi:hypothetical protein